MAGEEATRLLPLLSLMERLKGLVPVKDQFCMTVRHHALRSRVFAVGFQYPETVDEMPEAARRLNFAVAKHSGMIARIATRAEV